MNAQDVFYSLLGYSLKRDYLGDSFNWRNVETYNFTITAIDLANISTDIHGNNALSNYIRSYFSNRIGADRNNITIKSINIDGSVDENHIQKATYKVTAEVRTKIDQATLRAQHPELDTSDPNNGKDGEGGKFYGVETVFSGYTDQIDSLSESFDFSDKEGGGKDFSHTIDLSIRQGSWSSTPKQIAQSIANVLFSQDVNNTYFGHNAFSGALGTYGQTGNNNKHYFSESYDQFTNKFSFTKKMEVLPLDATTYTASKKYSMDVKQDGEITIAETIELKSRNGTFSNITNDVSSWIDAGWSRCNAIVAQYSNTIDGMGGMTSSTSPVLSSEPTSKTVAYNKQGLTATISLSFSTGLQESQKASFLETIDLSRDHRGVTTATYNVTLSSFRQKQLNADKLFYVDGLCSVAGECDSGNWTTKVTCEGEGECFDSDDNPVSGADNDESLCESVVGNYFVSAGNSWTAYDTETKCEDDGGANWTHGKTALDILKVYGDNAVTKICTIANYGNQAYGVKGVFWNTLSWYWPAGMDFRRPSNWHSNSVSWLSYEMGCDYYPVSSSSSSSNMGKSFTLNKVFSNDVIYKIPTMKHDATGTKNDYLKYCPNCFKKVEVKYQDSWPKETVSEHTIINRGGIGEVTWMPFIDSNGNIIYAPSETTAAVTSNKANTSVLSNSYVRQAGKRSVTINAALKRPLGNNLLEPEVPMNALKALSYEAKNTLLQVFLNDKIKNSYQYVAYISNISYTYNSENQITMTAELTYTYKAPPPLNAHP